MMVNTYYCVYMTTQMIIQAMRLTSKSTVLVETEPIIKVVISLLTQQISVEL